MKLGARFFFLVLALSFAAAPVNATFPGENGKIVFVGNQSGTWQLYTMDPDGSGILQITYLPATNWELWLPAFSPDGRRILFTHDTPENPCHPHAFPPACPIDLYEINTDGTGLIQLTNDGLSWSGKWSPDSRRIVFNHTSTSTKVNVVTTMRSDGTGELTALTSEFWDSGFGTYTPDGGKITFYSQNEGFIAATWTMNADGSNQRRLTAGSLEGGPFDVSPDGRSILLVNHLNTPFPNQIFALNIGTRDHDLVQLTPSRNGHDDPGAYSPDGAKIVFVSDRFSSNNSLDLFTMNADGSDVDRIASGITVGGCPDGNCVGPSWGPKPKR